MALNLSTPWHRRSFDRLIQERLPELLSERLPLVGYAVAPSGQHTCQVDVTLASGANGDIELVFPEIPQPDDDGLFELDGEVYVVVPIASHERLDEAEVRCVGEQLYDYIEARLGQAPADLPWDAELARTWLPLDAWVDAYLGETAQRLDSTNKISVCTHLRRLLVAEHENVVAPGQEKVVCLFESPEGPNMGRVFTVAQGAEIRDGRLVVTDERPEARLGLTASLIPFLEHNDANRTLMGANMLRQGLVPPDPEPALVRTGDEPDEPGFWTGRNLLTAFVSWGADTYADGIVVSASCAQRLNYPYPAEPGDKLANRHGTKGVVSRVLPDDEMPHLSDGTPVELVYSSFGMHVRLNHGQALEALWGRVARAEGEPVIAAPFHAPDRAALRARLEKASLPASGMELLTLGKDGPMLERPSLVGWVYWNRLAHLARGKIKVSARASTQMHGTMECQALRDIEAYENLREAINLRSGRRPDAGTLAARVAAGPVEQAGPPAPVYAALVKRLRVAGIEAILEGEALSFRFASPEGETLKLARPVPHPWLRGRELCEIGSVAGIAEDDRRGGSILSYAQRGSSAPPPSLAGAYDLLVEANERLARMLATQTPGRLVQDATEQLEARVNALFETLLYPAHLRMRERQLFSGRAVLAPGAGLQIDQVGLPDEMAWELLGPFVARDLGDEEPVRAKSARASEALDAAMARLWVIVNRAPTLSPTALLAFHPLRVPGPAIRLHPLACRLLDADFDGDQAAIYVPLTEAAQREAGESLSIAAHVRRDPSLVRELLPPPEALWSLASLGLAQGGLGEVSALAGAEVAAPNGVLNEDSLAEALGTVLARDGVDALLGAAQRLMDRGLAVVRASGASMSPFIGESLALPAPPEGDDPDQWQVYHEEVTERLLSSDDYGGVDIGPQLLALKARRRGRRQLPLLIVPWGPHEDIRGGRLTIRHSLGEGFTPQEMYAHVASARVGLASVWQRWQRLGAEAAHRAPSGFTVLARACRAARPGIVFARAAASGEVDPLTDVESRLLVGLPVVG